MSLALLGISARGSDSAHARQLEWGCSRVTDLPANETRACLIVRPNGADHQRGKDPPRQMLVRSGS